MTSAVDLTNFCRCCLDNQSTLFDMKTFEFDINGKKFSFFSCFFECGGINKQFAIPGIDDHPKICRSCSIQLKCSFVFRAICRKSDQVLRTKFMSKPAPTAALLIVSDKHGIEDNFCYNDIYATHKDDHPSDVTALPRTNRFIIDAKDIPLLDRQAADTTSEKTVKDEKGFKHPNVLTKLPARHKTPNVKPAHTCKYCAKKFTRRTNLWEHSFDHLSIVPFNCPHCDYKTKRKRNIVNHLLRSHNIAYNEQVHGYHEKNINYKDIRFSKTSKEIAEVQDNNDRAKTWNSPKNGDNNSFKCYPEEQISCNQPIQSSQAASSTSTLLSRRVSGATLSPRKKKSWLMGGYRSANGQGEQLTEQYSLKCPICGYCTKRKSIFQSHLRRHNTNLESIVTDQLANVVVDGELDVAVTEDVVIDVD